MKKMSFFIMSYKGFAVLKSLVNTFGTEIIDIVVTAKDSSIQNDYYTEIIEFCNENGLKVFNKNDSFTVSSPFTIAISWRWLIDLGTSKLIVFHDSLLPKYRGFAPLVSYLINNEPRVGVTALFASDEYDKGDIIGQSHTDITYPMKIENAIDLVTLNYIELAREIISKIKDGENLPAKKQNDLDATYSLWRDEEDYRIHWHLAAETIKRFIDAVGFPYNGAYSYINDRKIRILDSEVTEDVNIENRTIGKVIFVKGIHPVVVCGTGLLMLNAAIDNETRQSVLPLKAFRTRFR